MKTSTLIKVLIAISWVWLGLTIPIWWNFHVIDRHAGGYRTASMKVIDSACGVYGSDDSCIVDGEIDGSYVSLDIEASKRKQYPDGAEVKVLYNPKAPESGFEHQHLQVLEWTTDIGAEGRKFLRFGLRLWLSPVVLTVVVNLLYRFGVRRRTGIRDEIFEADLGDGLAPIAGVPLVGQGLAFLLLPRVAWGGLILGTGMVVLGTLGLRTRHLRVEKASRRLMLGRHLLGWRLAGTETILPPGTRVRISHEKDDFAVSVGVKPSFLEIVRVPLHDDARRLGEPLAEWLGTLLEDNIDVTAAAAERRKGKRKRR